MMRLWLFLIPICFIVLLFSGCAYFTHPKEQPVEHEYICIPRYTGIMAGNAKW